MAVSVCGPISIDQQGRELTEHGTALFPVACYHDRLSESAVPWHWHNELEVLVVETGKVRVSVNGTDRLVRQGEGPAWGLARGGGGLPPALCGISPPAGGRRCGQHPLAEVPGAPALRPVPALGLLLGHPGVGA